jgi:hypothetical protein
MLEPSGFSQEIVTNGSAFAICAQPSAKSAPHRSRAFYPKLERTIQASTGRIWIQSLREPFDMPIDGTVDKLPHIGGDPRKPTGIGQIVEAHI